MYNTKNKQFDKPIIQKSRAFKVYIILYILKVDEYKVKYMNGNNLSKL